MKSSLIRINLIFILLVLFIPNLVSADSKTFIKEYTYQASEADSKQTCRTLALEQVKRLLLEEIGTYLESQTEVKNFQLTHDQITTLTAGIVKTEIVAETWDGKEYQLKAKISADADSVVVAIDNLRKDQQKVKQLEEAKKKIDETIKEVNQLRKELAALKSDAKRKKKIGQYNTAVKKISIIDLYNKARSFYITGCMTSNDHCQESVDAFKKVIELDPGNADAYFECGRSYFNLGRYTEAINMFTTALKKGTKTRDYISVSHRGNKNEDVYSDRGDAFFYSDNYKAAINDYSYAIRLRPTFSKESVNTYIKRGDAYSKLSDYQKAINDYDQAVMIASSDDNYQTEQQSWWSEETKKYWNNFDKQIQYRHLLLSYSTRGWGYLVIGNVNQAINDLTKAIEIYPDAPVNARTYYLRAISYIQLGNAEKAIKDMDKAIELNPKESGYYNYRAICKTLFWASIVADQYKKTGYGYDSLKRLANYDSNIAKFVNYCEDLIEQSIKDDKIAAKLGNKSSQERLRSQGIAW